MLADDIGIVDVLGRMELEERVVVDEIVEAAGSHAEAGDDLPVIDGLLRAGDGAALDERHDPVAEHFGVDAEFLLVLEGNGQGLRDAADAALDGAAVLDKAGQVLSDLHEGIVQPGSAHLDDGFVAGDEHVDAVHVDEAIAECARHLGVHLGDDVFGAGDGGFDDVHRNAQAAQAVDVGRRDGDQRDVDGHAACLELTRYVRQEDGRVVGHAGLEDMAHVVRDEETVHLELLAELLIRVGGRAHGEQVDDVGVVHVLGMCDQGVDEVLRLGAAGADEHAVARVDELHGRGRVADSVLVLLLPIELLHSCPRVYSSSPTWILASTAMARVPSGPTTYGLMSSSWISGNSVTNCESLCSPSAMESMSTPSCPGAPWSN